MRDKSKRDFVGELIARREDDPVGPAGDQVLDLAGELEDFVVAEDPAHDFNEELRRKAEGGDPAPHIPDESFWDAWTGQRRSEDGR